MSIVDKVVKGIKDFPTKHKSVQKGIEFLTNILNETEENVKEAYDYLKEKMELEEEDRGGWVVFKYVPKEEVPEEEKEVEDAKPKRGRRPKKKETVS